NDDADAKQHADHVHVQLDVMQQQADIDELELLFLDPAIELAPRLRVHFLFFIIIFIFIIVVVFHRRRTALAGARTVLLVLVFFFLLVAAARTAQRLGGDAFVLTLFLVLILVQLGHLKDDLTARTPDVLAGELLFHG